MTRTMMGLMALALCASSGCSVMRPNMAERMKGRQAPDFELEAVDGTKAKLSAYRGRPVIVAFSATW